MMDEFYDIFIQFPKIEFNSFYGKGNVEVGAWYSARLYVRRDEIVLRIFYDYETYFHFKFQKWLYSINFKDFNSFIKTKLTHEKSNERLQSIDLSEVKLKRFTSGSNYIEDNRKYVDVFLDTVKFYYKPNLEFQNTAEFYFDDKGFRVVQPFYSILNESSNNEDVNSFIINRMRDSNMFFKFEDSEFRPEFNFVTRDNTNVKSISIVKEPKIQFKYLESITEENAIHYGEVVLMLASFYFHIKIDYTLRRIHLSENTLVIKNLEQKNYLDKEGYLWGFGLYWNFNQFLQSSWQKGTTENYKLLSKVIKKFNQSHLVNSSSAFLIKYNILEICDKSRKQKEKFTFVLNKNQRKEKQVQALTELLDTISEDEHEDFKKRWESVQAFLMNKPMKKQLNSFLESQNLDHTKFPISLKQLNQLRNNITHGSIDNVDTELLRKANILLYRICGILILNLMGIKEWELNTEIK